MRAAVVGVFHRDRKEARVAFGTALARVTHTDPRAVEEALFTAELAAACARSTSASDASRLSLFDEARPIVREPDLAAALDAARGGSPSPAPRRAKRQRASGRAASSSTRSPSPPSSSSATGATRTSRSPRP